jgi:hypothetical protein
MAKKKTVQQQNDDQVIIDGLMKIRAGIINDSWDEVCEGYNSITGEALEHVSKAPPPTRLERIRGALATKDSAEPATEAPKNAKSSSRVKTAAEIKEEDRAKDQEEPVSENEVVIQKKGDLTIITFQEDEGLKQRNKKDKEKTLALPPELRARKRSPKLQDESHTNKPMRFINEPRIGPKRPDTEE